MTNIYSDLWEFDISQAPKSHTSTETRTIKGQTVEVEVTKSVYILAAGYLTSGPGVTKTRWLPDQERWEGWSKGKEPLAWLPYPECPEIGV